MTSTNQARAHARALASAVVLGAGLGVVLGGAYMAGGAAGAAVSHARTARLAVAASEGFSEQALQRDLASMRPGAFAIARRHDPYTTAGYAQRDRQTALLAARLENSGKAAAGGLLKASLSTPAGMAAYRVDTGALGGARDFECLSQAVYYEARGENAAGQAAVAQVVLNRARHRAFPNSVCGVVFQGAHRGSCQFSFACNGAMRRGKEPGAWRRAKAVAARALSGFVMAEVGSATHFHTTGVSPGWRNLTRVSRIGTHIFYRFGGGGGAARVFNARIERSAPEIAEKPIYGYKVLGPSADGHAEEKVILASATIEKPTTAAPKGAAAEAPEKASGAALTPVSTASATARTTAVSTTS